MYNSIPSHDAADPSRYWILGQEGEPLRLSRVQVALVFWILYWVLRHSKSAKLSYGVWWLGVFNAFSTYSISNLGWVCLDGIPIVSQGASVHPYTILSVNVCVLFLNFLFLIY